MADVDDFRLDMLGTDSRTDPKDALDVNREFVILSVCTGNICRSPLAEQLLATRLQEIGINALVHSAGTAAMVGYPMPDPAAELSTRYGGEPSAHRAQQLDEHAINGADLVLTAAREHRADVVLRSPRALPYTFTLRQFARIASALSDDDLAAIHTPRELVATVAAQRGFVPPPENPSDDDVVDPYRQSQDIYDASGEAIDLAVSAIVAVFARTMKR